MTPRFCRSKSFSFSSSSRVIIDYKFSWSVIDACGREDDVACAKYRTTRHDDAKKVVVVVDDLFENRF